MYYIAICIIAILCGDYVNGDCNDDPVFYSNPSVNAPIGSVIVQDCKQWRDIGITKSDIYPINPDGGKPFQVYCDMETDDGGWTVIQRRMDGSIDFYRDFVAYENGFGNLNFEFWLGLAKIHRLTAARGATELLIKLTDFDGNTAHAKYSTFNIGSNDTMYTLTIAGYSGTANDSMSYNNNMKFTTRDNDNDQYDGNCAATAKGAWWYNECTTDANLNGMYHDSPVTGSNSVSWYQWKSAKESLQFVEMMLRPTQEVQEPTEPPTLPPVSGKDCKEIKEEDGTSASGLYTINPDDGEPFQVYCDMETDGGGWTVFQKRQDGSVDFYRGWTAYSEGFGDLSNEFWLGLSKIHRITEAGVANTLRIELGDLQGNTAYATYSTFKIGDNSTEYTLTATGYGGNAGDGIGGGGTAGHLNGYRFSTKDNDNDDWADDSCAVHIQGAWWFNSCTHSHLNGPYNLDTCVGGCIGWYFWTNEHWVPLSFSEMKTRRN